MSLRERLNTLFDRADRRGFSHTPNYDNFVPGKDVVLYAGPVWGAEELIAAINALVSGRWLTSGDKVARFENVFCDEFLPGGRALMVNSGSSANLVMLLAAREVFRWADGDEVIVSASGFATTVSAVVQAGLRPVFVDVEENTLNMDLSAVAQVVGPHTRAVLLSPMLGNPPDVDRLVDVCREKRLTILLDSCDSLGSRWRDVCLSEFAAVTITSFFPAHHISTGEGGMVYSRNEALVSAARSYAWWGRGCYCAGTANLSECGTCGRRMSAWLSDYDGVLDHRYVFDRRGYNLKPLDLQGAIGIAQMARWSDISSGRKRSHDFLRSAIVGESLARGVAVVPGATPCWFGLPLGFSSQAERDAFAAWMAERKVQTRMLFAGNLLAHGAFREFGDPKMFPGASTIMERWLFLGCHPSYTGAVLDYVAQSAVGFFRRMR